MNLSKTIAILCACALMAWAFSIGGLWACAGIAIAVYVIYDFLVQEDDWIPIGEIALVMGALQWIISTLVSYTMPVSYYEMSLPCDEYMMRTVPLFACFAFGVLRFRKSMSVRSEQLAKLCLRHWKLSGYFIGIGVFFMFIPLDNPLINQMKIYLADLFYVGFFMRMIAKPSRSTFYMAVPLGVVLFKGIIGGSFHDVLVWGIFFILIWFQVNKVSLQRKVLIIVSCLLVVNILQGVKSIYRDQIWYGDYSGNKIGLFVNLLIANATGNLDTSEGADNNSRYNQGWIICSIYNNVPSKHDYFYGRTFADAAISAAVPRLLVPNKKGAGAQSREDFIEMTGYPLGEKTSMGLSILGESYGNFGLIGGCIFMLFWGWFLTQIVRWACQWTRKYCFLWVLFLPIISFNLIKAEISMMSVLNWTVKGLIFSAMVMLFVKRQYNVQRLS